MGAPINPWSSLGVDEGWLIVRGEAHVVNTALWGDGALSEGGWMSDVLGSGDDRLWC